MTESYLNAVRLLLSVAPAIFRDRRLALKGGTAINLFVRDLPRLSVDLDLVMVDHTVPRPQALADISDTLRTIREELTSDSLLCETGASTNGSESKLFVERAGTRIKVEVNHVFRGAVLPVEDRPLAPQAQDLFFTEIAVPLLHPDELYGSKLVAAMDRQHPRDWFDVLGLFANGGLSHPIVECFVSYLAGHNRPIHEVLFANPNDLAPAFKNEFSGMAREPVSLEDLLAARRRLFTELPGALSQAHREFLLGFARAEPDWSLMRCDHLASLPAIRWKLENLRKLKVADPTKFAQQESELATRFGV